MASIRSHLGIPCVDLERAMRFYGGLVEGAARRNEHVPFPMAYLADGAGAQLGHLFVLEGFNPSEDGVIAYLDCGDIAAALERVEAFGGRVALRKTLIAPGRGYWAMFVDTEGNRLALHADR